MLRFSTMVALVSQLVMSLPMPLMTTVAGLVDELHLLMNFFQCGVIRFGPEGNLEDWWSKDTATEFHTRAECLVRTSSLCSQL